MRARDRVRSVADPGSSEETTHVPPVAPQQDGPGTEAAGPGILPHRQTVETC